MPLYVSSVKGGCAASYIGVLDFLVGLECRKENRPFSGQQHQAQFGLNPALPPRLLRLCLFTSAVAEMSARLSVCLSLCHTLVYCIKTNMIFFTDGEPEVSADIELITIRNGI